MYRQYIVRLRFVCKRIWFHSVSNPTFRASCPQASKWDVSLFWQHHNNDPSKSVLAATELLVTSVQQTATLVVMQGLELAKLEPSPDTAEPVRSYVCLLRDVTTTVLRHVLTSQTVKTNGCVLKRKLAARGASLRFIQNLINIRFWMAVWKWGFNPRVRPDQTLDCFIDTHARVCEGGQGMGRQTTAL